MGVGLSYGDCACTVSVSVEERRTYKARGKIATADCVGVLDRNSGRHGTTSR